jgi:hypothetical protein
MLLSRRVESGVQTSDSDGIPSTEQPHGFSLSSSSQRPQQFAKHCWRPRRSHGVFSALVLIITIIVTSLLMDISMLNEILLETWVLLDYTGTASQLLKGSVPLDENGVPLPFSEDELRGRHLAKNESFAGCLMVLDENHRLPEWLAYHYHVLPLRHLVIHSEPRSKLNITLILDEWRHVLGGDFTFDEWTTKDYSENDAAFQYNENTKFSVIQNRQRSRHHTFLKACSVHLHHKGYHWTSFQDADEYLTLSSEYFGRLQRARAAKKISSSQTGERSQPFLAQSGSFLKVLKSVRTPQNTDYVLPGVRQPQSVAHNLTQACIAIPRARYASIDIPLEEQQQYQVLDPNAPAAVVIKTVSRDELNVTALDTMRFRIRHTPRNNRQAASKSIIDVSQMNATAGHLIVKKKLGNSHRPHLDLCAPEPIWDIYGQKMPFGIHHYYGSREAHMYKTDYRGPEFQLDRFEREALNGSFRDDDEICSWLSGFVANVGLERAQFLLRKAQYLQPK